MRITIAQGAFLPVPPKRGGAIEKAFHALAQEFASEGHTVNYISRLCDGLPSKQTESTNLRHNRIKGYDAPKSLLMLKWLDLLYSIRMLRNLPDADILITHTFWLPILVRNNRTGKLYVHVGRSPKGQMKLYRHAARLQTVSSPIAKRIREELSEADGELSKVLPYPLDPAFLQSIDLQKKGTSTLLFTGRIHPEKGLELLIKAFTIIPSRIKHNWKLKIVGPWRKEHGGAGLKYLNSLKASGKDANIQFAEPIFNQQQLIAEYDNACVFAYPSLAEEGETFGLSALEAMSRGCLTLVSDLECFKDFISHGENGFVFSHRTTNPAHTLAKHLISLLGSPKDHGNVAVKAVAKAQSYSPALVAKSFLEDFHNLTKKQ